MNLPLSVPVLCDNLESMSLEEVFDKLQHCPDISEQRLLGIKSSFKRLARISGDPWDRVYPLSQDFRDWRLDLCLVDHGIARKSLQNIQSDLCFALRRTELEPLQRIRDTPLSRTWRKVVGLLDNRYERTWLIPFGRFCSGLGIAPEGVTDDVALAYMEARNLEGFKNPRTMHGTVIRRWNWAVDKVPSWPRNRLAKPAGRESLTFPDELFPRSFIEDREAYLDILACDDPFEEKAPPRALRPRSIIAKRYQIKRAAAELIRLGHNPSRITSLAYLVEYENYRDLLRALFRQAGGRKGWIYDLARSLITTAKYWLQVPDDQLAPMKMLARKLVSTQPGLTPKNRKILQKLEDPERLSRFLSHPVRRMEALLHRDDGKRRFAVELQKALAIELLLFTALRIGNLAGLHMENHMCWTQPRLRGCLQLSIPEVLVKNDHPLTIEVPDEVARYVRLYIERFRPRLLRGDHSNHYLFPGIKGRAKRADTMSRQISFAIEAALGFRMNPHAFRHFAARIILRNHPAAYALVSRICGHKSSETAYRYYSGEEVREAFAIFDRLILEARNQEPDRIRGRCS